MHDRVNDPHSSAEHAINTLPTQPKTLDYETLQDASLAAPSVTECPPTIGEKGREEGVKGGVIRVVGRSLLLEGMPLAGLDTRSGLVGLHGVEWLRNRVKKDSDLQRCTLVLGEMLLRSIEFKRDYVPLGSEWLRGILGDESGRSILGILKEIGAIEPAGQEGPWYWRITRRYRFTEQYRSQPFGTVSIAPKLIQRYITYYNRRLQLALEAAPIYRALWDDIQHVSLHSSWVETVPQFAIGDWRKQLAWHRSYDEIYRRSFRFSCSLSKAGKFPKPGRIYTTFTSTPSKMRQYALLDGMPLVCLDVKASQPFLHSTLIPDSAEKRRYLEAVKSDKFYEELGAAGNWQGNSRAELKEAVFASVFYGKLLPQEKASPIWKAFQLTYPGLATAISYEKRNNNRDLAIKMQYLEAEIILHTALPALKQADPSIRVLTVHDAIYVTEDHIRAAKDALHNAFATVTGNCPELREERSALVDI